MHGREVFRHAVDKAGRGGGRGLGGERADPGEVDWLVPHQANLRIIDAMGRKLGLPPERVVVTVDRHANTSAASVPLALSRPGMTDASAAATLCCWRRWAAG